MSSSSGFYGSAAQSSISCDAWGVARIGNINAGQTSDNAFGVGVSSFVRVGEGEYLLTLSNPERYGSGLWALMYTREQRDDLTSHPHFGTNYVGAVGQTFQSPWSYPSTTQAVNQQYIGNYRFSSPAGTSSLSGGTLEKVDGPDNDKVRLNYAAFCFRGDTYPYVPVVENLINYSSEMTNWTRNANDHNLSLSSELVAPDGSKGYVNVFYEGESSATDQRWIYSSYIPFTPSASVGTDLQNRFITGSVYVKAGTRYRGRVLIYDLSNTFFGITFNLNTKTVSSTTNYATLTKSSIRHVGNDWYRIEFTGFYNQNATTAAGAGIPHANRAVMAINIADDSGNLVYAGLRKELYVWGAMVNFGTFAPDYSNHNYAFDDRYDYATGTTSGYLTVDGLIRGRQTDKIVSVPGASGYGITGATYSSHVHNTLMSRQITAYGTLVIPGISGENVGGAYVEDMYNIRNYNGVSGGKFSLYDIHFGTTMDNENYCVIASLETEPDTFNESPTSPPQLDEFAFVQIRSGLNGKFKTVNSFRLEILRLNKKIIDTAKGYSVQQTNERRDRAKTDRIHFMVFGGKDTYGAP